MTDPVPGPSADAPTYSLGPGVERGPAAVLMVDIERREVVHVSDVALELAPGVSLPIGLDAWSDAAELRDLDGDELSETRHPLSRVGRSEPVSGQVVSAARRSALGERRQPLWVAGVPMQGAPGLEGLALVVLVPLRNATDLVALAESRVEQVGTSPAPGRDDTDDSPTGWPGSDGGRLAELRDRAVGATSLSFTVADVTRPDQPLVWVNDAFTATTGYTLDDVVGRNCRFLQDGESDPDAARRMRTLIESGTSGSVVVRNVTKDGTPFWNQVDLSPISDARGRVTHFVGIQNDVTQRVVDDAKVAEILSAEKGARAEAERARRRLSFLVEALNQLTGTLDEDESAERLLGLVVPFLADWALLLRVDPGPANLPVTTGAAVGPGRPTVAATAVRHRDPARQHEVEELGRVLPSALRDGHLVDLLLDGRQVRLIDRLSDPASHEKRSRYLHDMSLVDLTRGLDGEAALLVAVSGRTTVHDVLVLVRTTGRAAFDEDDIDTAVDLGNRAGLLLENASLYQGQRRIARALQDSMLSTLPRTFSRPGVAAAGRYVANEVSADVGGDFYDVVDHGDGRLSITVGDVVGHDILAAGSMGHLKGLLRGAGRNHDASPAEVLRRVDEISSGMPEPIIATAALVHAVPAPGGWRLTHTSAGHPPLVLLEPDGSARPLRREREAGVDTLLGVGLLERTDDELVVPPGSVLIGFSDGLVERRGLDIDDGVAEIVRAVEGSPHPADDVEALCDHVIDHVGRRLGGSLEDDVALLAVHLP